MKKRKTLLIHFAGWLVVLASPMMTINQEEDLNWARLLFYLLPPCMMMVVFYANYLWLAPRQIASGNRRGFWAANALLVVVLGLVQHGVMYTLFYKVIGGPHPPSRTPFSVLTSLLILRNIFTLGLTVVMANAIVRSARLQAAEEARLQAEAERTEAELRQLRSQVNPHFLLNTLNNIYALTAFDTRAAQVAIEQLSKLLRHMLYDNQKQMIRLRDELRFLQHYVNLMKLRLPDNVSVSFSHELTDNEATVAPLLFVSLIENAFKHGVSPTKRSFIDICIVADERHIVCDIVNSNFPKRETDRSGHGVGLQQVARRLELTYPGRYKWDRGVSPDGLTYKSRIEIERR